MSVVKWLFGILGGLVLLVGAVLFFALRSMEVEKLTDKAHGGGRVNIPVEDRENVLLGRLNEEVTAAFVADNMAASTSETSARK